MLLAPYLEVLVAEMDLEIIRSEDARIETVKPYLNHLNNAYLGFIYTKINLLGKGVNAK